MAIIRNRGSPWLFTMGKQFWFQSYQIARNGGNKTALYSRPAFLGQSPQAPSCKLRPSQALEPTCSRVSPHCPLSRTSPPRDTTLPLGLQKSLSSALKISEGVGKKVQLTTLTKGGCTAMAGLLDKILDISQIRISEQQQNTFLVKICPRDRMGSSHMTRKLRP